MAINVVNTETKVNLKYPSDTGKKLSAYSLGVDVKNDAPSESYYALAQAVMPMVNADDRECEAITLTITETIE